MQKLIKRLECLIADNKQCTVDSLSNMDFDIAAIVADEIMTGEYTADSDEEKQQAMQKTYESLYFS